jgi:hypothetical protein
MTTTTKAKSGSIVAKLACVAGVLMLLYAALSMSQCTKENSHAVGAMAAENQAAAKTKPKRRCCCVLYFFCVLCVNTLHSYFSAFILSVFFLVCARLLTVLAVRTSRLPTPCYRERLNNDDDNETNVLTKPNRSPQLRQGDRPRTLVCAN